jgi:hypothetical protein
MAPAPGAMTPSPGADQKAVSPLPGGDQNMAAMSTEKFLDKQGDQQILASSWIGSSVYNSSDESLGDINDLLLDANHQIVAIVVGVGGFLGIGQKSVAIGIDSVDVTTDADGNQKLIVDATKDELNSAPTFTTLAQLKTQEVAPAEPAPVSPAPGAGDNLAPSAPQ